MTRVPLTGISLPRTFHCCSARCFILVSVCLISVHAGNCQLCIAMFAGMLMISDFVVTHEVLD